MEKAFLITYKTNFEKLKNNLDNFDYLYFGDAYCEFNFDFFLSDKIFLEKLFFFNKKLVLVTPMISNLYISKLRKFLIEYSDNIYEIVVNDYGVFNLIKEEFGTIKIIWGNFLLGQSKDPYLKTFQDKDTHKKLTIDNDFFKDFFMKNNIKSIEIYNTYQGIDIQKNFGLHIYFPFVVYTTTRYCPFKLLKDGKNYLTIQKQCDGCINNVNNKLSMYIDLDGENLDNYFVGNIQFYKNENLINDSKINRIIYNYDLLG